MISIPALTARIAIVDDDPTQRTLLKHLVEGLGHHVVCMAEDGQQAIERCCDKQLDLVLMDLDMPQVDGLEAADHISRQGIPVVLMSGLPDAENLVVEREPIVARLLKPVSVAALSNAINQAVGLPENPAD